MSEENSRADPKITSLKKEKDSKHVEAGKRLAQLKKKEKFIKNNKVKYRKMKVK